MCTTVQQKQMLSALRGHIQVSMDDLAIDEEQATRVVSSWGHKATAIHVSVSCVNRLAASKVSHLFPLYFLYHSSLFTLRSLLFRILSLTPNLTM